jgi:uncharacterized protein
MSVKLKDDTTRFHVMAKPVGPSCNLDCTYCFYLSKEKLLHTGANPRMSDEVLEEFIKQYIQGQNCDEIIFSWQGGEPTLAGLDFFKKVVALERKYFQGKRIDNDFQTNGVLLDDKWCAFLKENNFLVGLSVDGPREFHDKYRYDKGGNSTFDKVFKATGLLKKHDVLFNALVTANRENAKHPIEVYRFLRDEVKPRAIQFAPCVEPKVFTETAPPYGNSFPYPKAGTSAAKPGNPDSIVTDWSVDADDYGKFLCDVFDEWHTNDIGQTFIYNFEYTLSLWLGRVQGVGCRFAPFCGKGMAIEHDGSVYSCDHFVYPEYRLGNIKEDILSRLAFSKKQREFGYDKRESLPATCLACQFLPVCNGECPKNRFLLASNGKAGLNYLCRGLQRYFNHITPFMNKMADDMRKKNTVDVK